MNRHNFQRRSGVIIDVCKAHGTWLDADELEQIGGFIRSGAYAVAQSREAERQREEARTARAAQLQHEMRERFHTSPGSHGSKRADFQLVESVVDFLNALLS